MNKKYDELKAYKIVQKIVEGNCEQLELLEIKLSSCENEYTNIQNEIQTLKTEQEMDYEIFSPRTDHVDNAEVIDCKKNLLSDIGKEKNSISKQISFLKSENEDLLFVQNTLSEKVNVSNDINITENTITEKLRFCMKLCEVDPKRAKVEIEKILDNVPRETL